jgi:hypothetical protein
MQPIAAEVPAVAIKFDGTNRNATSGHYFENLLK